jgi:hypothetical protein
MQNNKLYKPSLLQNYNKKMKNKLTSLFIFGLLSLVMALSLVSALNFEVSQANNLFQKTNSTFTVKNNEAFPISVVITLPTIGDGTRVVPIAASTLSFTLTPSNTTNVMITAGTMPTDLKLGSFSGNIQVTATNPLNTTQTDSKNTSLNFINSFCTNGDLGSGVEITKLTDEQLDNENEWEWAPLDNVEITVKVKNNAGDDLDFVVEYGLYDASTNDYVDLNEDTIDLSVDDGKSEETTIKFEVPADIDSNDDYRFYVKAYEDGEEETRCVSQREGKFFEDIDIKKKSREVVLTKIVVPDSVSCSDAVDYKARVYNIGNKDEDQVKVTLTNKELGINMQKEIKNIDSGDYEDVTFSFVIPQNATEKTYKLVALTEYNYDDNDEVYDDSSDDTFDTDLKIEGGCKAAVTPTVKDDVRITASQETESALAGKEVVIRATLTNTGDKTQTYNLLLSGIDSFATLEKIEPSTLTIDSGKSADALVYLMAKSDAAGDYTFSIKSIFGSKTKDQPVSISFPAKGGSSITGLSIVDSIKNNWLITVIVLVNIVLIILIIVVAVRISSK